MQNMDIKDIVRALKEYDGEEIRIMEVCGTHTAAISENGIPSMLSPKIKLISGPGCPVCVTVTAVIDKLIELSMRVDTIVLTFGDLIRVKGTNNSLADAKADGAHVRMVYSPMETISLAKMIQIIFMFLQRLVLRQLHLFMLCSLKKLRSKIFTI